MALPVVPIAGMGILMLAGYLAARKVQRGRVDQRAEDAMDELPDGISGVIAPDRDQGNAGMRYRRVIRWGDRGRGVKIDVAVLGRLRWQRVPQA